MQTDINFQTVKKFRKLLVERKKSLLNDNKTILELFDLKNFLLKFEDFVIESRSKAAAKELSQMTEEERRTPGHTSKIIKKNYRKSIN